MITFYVDRFEERFWQLFFANIFDNRLGQSIMTTIYNGLFEDKSLQQLFMTTVYDERLRWPFAVSF